jgi:hypothetical protein
MNAYREGERKLLTMREQVTGSGKPLALTECHFALPGRNRCEVLSSWAAGVANARILNLHERHGDVLKIATLADFCGNRWQVNAIMIPTPQGPQRRSYLMPVGRVMALYRRYSGESAVTAVSAPAGLDVTASRTGDRLFLHVVNTRRKRAVLTTLQVEGYRLVSGSVHTIVADPTEEIMETCPDLFNPVTARLPEDASWTFPAASVSAVELLVR